MGMPVVTVASGGLPVGDMTGTGKGGVPVTEATNKFGVAVTKVTGGGGMPVVFETIGGGGGGGGAEAAAFLARTSGLDATHTNAYTALINGLVADGVWSKLDLLHIYATQDSTTAKLNLVSTSYSATVNGSPVFTADRGYMGVDASSTVYINTGFNPASAPSPKYTLNSAHLSLWSLTNVVSFQAPFAALDGTNQGLMYIRWGADNNFYTRVNNSGSVAASVISTDATGHFISNRSSSTQLNGYRNGSSTSSNASASSVGVPNANFYSLGQNSSGTASGAAYQEAAISIGASLNSTEATNFYNRLRTYMTAIGVP